MENITRFFQTFYFPKLNLLDIVEILIIVFVVYQLQKSLKNTRAWVIIKGIIILGIVYLISAMIGLNVIETIFQSAISICVLATIILFEPEIKKLLEELGTHRPKDLLKILKNKEPLDNKLYSDKTIKELVDACQVMSDAKTGALIIIEQTSILNEYINTGIQINADISSQLLINIFEHNTPLHDGAVIIRKNQVVAATCYLPLSDNSKINKNLGTRHRAGIGISELTDSIVIIVSEETGKISVVKDCNLTHDVSIETLHNLLNEYQSNEKLGIKTNLHKTHLKDTILSQILCLCFGFFLWLGIINSQDPLTTKSYTIPVTITNESALSDIGKTYKISSGDKITVEVTTARSIQDDLTESSFTAIADCNKLSYTYSVPIEVTIPLVKSTDYKINTNNATLQLSLDELVEMNVDVTPIPVGKYVDGYYVTALNTNINQVTIKGAKSLVKTIARVEVEVPINGKNEDFTIKRQLKIYDKNGNVVDSELLNLSDTEVTITGIVKPTKEIPINLSIINANTENFSLVEYSTDIDTILIAADEDILKDIDSLDIQLDLSNEKVSENYIKTLVLNDYLPKKAVIASDINKLNVNMTFNLYDKYDYDLDVLNINVLNLGSNLKILYSNPTVTLTFKGTQEALSDLDFETLNFSIDVKNLYAGKYNLTIHIENLPNDIMVVSDNIVEFTLKK